MKAKAIGVVCLFCFFTHAAIAAISLSGTRLIYPEGKKEVSLQINNHGQLPVLTQNWIDDGNSQATPDAVNVPFIMTPPVARVNANKGQVLRISALPGDLPKDRESVFWINVLEIPVKNQSADNTLQMAFRTRIKLFYRPTALAGKPEEAVKKIIWRRLSSDRLEAVNPTPWSVSVASVTSGKWSAAGDLVPAFGKTVFHDGKHPVLPVQGDVVWSWINDFGAERPAKSALSH